MRIYLEINISEDIFLVYQYLYIYKLDVAWEINLLII
jgi:hypothetical protein